MNTTPQWDQFLLELNSRQKESTVAFKKGDLFKLGSVCHKVTKSTKTALFTIALDHLGNEAGVNRIAHGSILPHLVRLTAADVDRAIALRAAEDVQPYNPLAGLSAAVGAYLVAEHEITSRG